jgi:hypothetical protein
LRAPRTRGTEGANDPRGAYRTARDAALLASEPSEEPPPARVARSLGPSPAAPCLLEVGPRDLGLDLSHALTSQLRTTSSSAPRATTTRREITVPSFRNDVTGNSGDDLFIGGPGDDFFADSTAFSGTVSGRGGNDVVRLGDGGDGVVGDHNLGDAGDDSIDGATATMCS